MVRKKVIIIFVLITLIVSNLVNYVFAAGRHIEHPSITLYSKRFDGLLDTSIKNEVYEYLKDNYGYDGDVLRYKMKIHTTAVIKEKNILNQYTVKIGNKEFPSQSKDKLINRFAIDSDNEENFKEGYSWDVLIVASFSHHSEDVNAENYVPGYIFEVTADTICSETDCSICESVQERGRSSD